MPVRSRRRLWFVIGTASIALFAIVLRVAIPIARQHASLAKVESFGGTIVRRQGQTIVPEWLRAWIGEEWMLRTDEIKGISFFTTRDEIQWRCCTCNDGQPGITEGQSVDNESLVCVTEFPELTHLAMRWTKVSDAGLVHLTELRKLEVLDLQGTDVSDASIDLLAGLSALRRLNLVDTKISREKVDELRRALPRCRIDYNQLCRGDIGWLLNPSRLRRRSE